MFRIVCALWVSQTGAQDDSSCLVAALVIVGLVALLAWLGNSDGPGATAGQTPPPDGPSPADREAVESLVSALNGIVGADRLDRLRGAYGELPARLPPDRIPALLEGLRGQTRFQGIRLLQPKFPRSIPTPIALQIADPALMTADERNRALALIYPNQGNQ